MKRFYNNDENQNDDEFNYEEGDGQEADFEPMDPELYLESIQMDLVELDMNQKILRESIEIAKSDLLWWFRTPEEKANAIDTVYRRLSTILDGGIIEKMSAPPSQGNIQEEEEE